MIQPVNILTLPTQRQAEHDSLVAQTIPCQTPGVDPELWFSSTQSRETVVAQVMCTGCPIKAACLRDGLSNDRDLIASDGHPYGVWGGYTGPMRGRFRAAPEQINPGLWRVLKEQSGFDVFAGQMIWPTVQGRPMEYQAASRQVKAVIRKVNPL